LLGLFSLVTLAAHRRFGTRAPLIREAGWYRKSHPTFADALAVVRRELWWHQTFQPCAHADDVVKLPRQVLERLTDTLCYAA
jgi:hypothetical protein